MITKKLIIVLTLISMVSIENCNSMDSIIESLDTTYNNTNDANYNNTAEDNNEEYNKIYEKLINDIIKANDFKEFIIAYGVMQSFIRDQKDPWKLNNILSLFKNKKAEIIKNMQNLEPAKCGILNVFFKYNLALCQMPLFLEKMKEHIQKVQNIDDLSYKFEYEIEQVKTEFKNFENEMDYVWYYIQNGVSCAEVYVYNYINNCLEILSMKSKRGSKEYKAAERNINIIKENLQNVIMNEDYIERIYKYILNYLSQIN